MTIAASGVPANRLLVPAHRHMTDNGRRARYGAAYVRALCAAAGAGFAETSIDEDVMAVDATVGFPRLDIRLQIKCTSKFKVSGTRLALPLQPEWVEKWTESDSPVFVVVVKVPSSIPSWVTFDPGFTRHETVAYGRRFNAGQDTTSMRFTAAHRLTTESIYDWRDLAYDVADGIVA